MADQNDFRNFVQSSSRSLRDHLQGILLCKLSQWYSNHLETSEHSKYKESIYQGARHSNYQPVQKLTLYAPSASQNSTITLFQILHAHSTTTLHNLYFLLHSPSSTLPTFSALQRGKTILSSTFSSLQYSSAATKRQTHK